MRAVSVFALLTMLLLAPAPTARADEPVCSEQAPCSLGATQDWSAGKRSAFVSRQRGGVLNDPATRVRFDFPPGAVPLDLTVTYESGITPPAPAPQGKRALGFFRLQATDAQGSDHPVFDAAWTVSIDYDACGQASGLCALELIDEASLHCAGFDAESGVWQEIAGQVDVFTNRLTCSAASAADFAVLAMPAATSGETDYHHAFLPLVAR